MSKTENLQEISENIKRAQNIIRTVDEVIVDLNQAAGNVLQERGPINLWKGILLFDKFDRKAGAKKAKRIIGDMKYLMEEFIDSLKKINENLPEYKYDDYGIGKEFAEFYAHFQKFDMSKIKSYKFDFDLKFLNSISAKAAKIKNDIDDIKSNLSKIF